MSPAIALWSSLLTVSATPADARTVALNVVCLAPSTAVVALVRWVEVVLPEVRAIWTREGVLVRAGAAPASTCDHTIVVRADAEAPADEAGEARALGWAPIVAGHVRPVVYVRLGAIARLGATLGSDYRPLAALVAEKLLGRVVAHELGHILLDSTEHVRAGLMRERYRVRDVLVQAPAAYGLTPAQHDRLRQQLHRGDARDELAGPRVAVEQP